MKHPRLAAVLISGGVLLPVAALAEAPASEKTAPPISTPQPGPDVSKAQGSPPPPAAPQEAENLVRVYGVVNTRVTVASGAVESYSQPNAVAITAAGNPVISNSPDDARYSFQAAQTRFGLWANEKGRLRGHLELDFVDYTKATPTVASMPRLRIADAEYTFAPGHVVSLGQDWDLHAPLNPHGINMVGALFLAGNTAFMRQQAKYLYSGTSLELGAALGFPAPNNTPKDAALELGSIPTLAVRAAYKAGKSKVGVSAIGTSFPFAYGTPQERRGFAFSAAAFTELFPTTSTNIRAEVNFGQDSANLGLLTLAQGQVAADVREVGGWVSVRQALASEHALYAMFGTEHVLNRADVVPSYSYAAPPADGSPPPFTSAALAGTGPGILNNTAARVGYEFKPMSNASFVVEGFGYRTHHQLQAVDVDRTSAVRHAYGIETGVLLSF